METNATNRSQIPIYAVIVAILAASGLYYFHEPLKTFRPAKPPAKPPSMTAEVEARLWQDPILAVRKSLREHERKAGEPGELTLDDDPSFLRRNVEKELAQGKRILMLPVMVPGGYSANDYESRLRSRYAVIAALDVAGYTSVLWDRIRWFRLSRGWFSDSCSDGDTDRDSSLVVPFEWCARNALNAGMPNLEGPKFDMILLLWLQDKEFLKKPITRLGKLAMELGPTGNSKVSTVVLGPTHSDGLQAMNKELAELQYEEKSPPPLKVYSPWATVHNSLLFLGKEGLKKEGDIIVRTIASDRDLVCGLISELGHRGVKWASDRVAIISEWDTFYGRALPLTFGACVKEGWYDNQDEETWLDNLKTLRRDDSEWPQNIRRVKYLQGLDGKIPGDEKGNTVENEDEKGKESSIHELERPEGPSQLDYLRRLADRLYLREERKLKAIGILGSDVYDKLLLLQALRERFPHAIFFTTDLDARLLHTSQTSWARNLIVASSFGLDLEEGMRPRDDRKYLSDYGFQCALPPFRDAYQTSLFVATLEALKCMTEDSRKKFSETKLYEVGRTGARLLPDERKRDLMDALKPWLLPIGMALILCGCISYLRRGRLGRPATGRPMHLLVYGLFLLVTTLAGIIIWAFVKGAPEPFAWFEGISIWPSEILRLLAAFLALHFLVKGHRMISKSNTELSDRFRLPPKPPPTANAFPSRKWWSEKWSIVAGPWTKEEDAVDVKRLWEVYLSKGEPGSRWLRVAFLSLLYGGLGVSLIVTHGTPAVPYRGPASQWADTGILIMSVSLLVLLIFYVIDGTLLCERFIKELSKAPLRDWPPGLLQSWQNEQGKFKMLRARLLSVQLLATRTEVVGSLIPYPFIVLLLMIISRVSLFDRWDWPLGLIIVLGLNSFCAICCSLVLWRAAQKAKSSILQDLKENMFERHTKEAKAERLSLVIEEIERLRRGAFAPLAEQPVLRAILIPFGGIGSAMLLEFIATGF